MWSQQAPAGALIFGRLFIACFATIWTSGMGFGAVVLALQAIGGAPNAPWLLLALIALFSAFGVVWTASAWHDVPASFATLYALTDRRLIIASWWPLTVLRSFDADHFRPMERVSRGERGEIRFSWGRVGKRSEGFRESLFGLADAAGVEAAIRAALKV